ncbi:5-bromo-4-chloroindolyl phosphate hydrolysis family protein [Rhodovulum adriaticum]|uniref:5-bromo-4-chloroindolyl phosphate hydrolysis protein n=1 Tax=Rhodovulum adriaticum TaxID=35804 RepID=A0A4R2NI33_RHOAD|nr:5-bromo-4-chloroindolyl phosphate hydrolysis family protein [Rhodovulum adriaticum]MBK1635407.1 hypothetical protein [Rhodovulum adriaticum]TCP21113.1 5-bromo-4-chloroindolyl phosphate hydrolysis protein [Rhodovulum adriaticum]
MRLPDGLRQIVAATLAAALFLGLFFGVQLVWWAAFGLAAVTYGALLLIVGRRTPADEIVLGHRVTAADVSRTAEALETAAARLSAAAQNGPKTDRGEIARMAAHLRSIRQKILADPEDYRSTRRFVTSYLPHMVETVERYADLARLARENHADRVARLRARILSYGPVLDRIDQACLENDFAALEVEVDALATQMKRG